MADRYGSGFPIAFPAAVAALPAMAVAVPHLRRMRRRSRRGFPVDVDKPD